jgi:hypothetical protein
VETGTGVAVREYTILEINVDQRPTIFVQRKRNSNTVRTSLPVFQMFQLLCPVPRPMHVGMARGYWTWGVRKYSRQQFSDVHSSLMSTSHQLISPAARGSRRSTLSHGRKKRSLTLLWDSGIQHVHDHCQGPVQA